MLRLTDLTTGRSIDLVLTEEVLAAFREQLERGDRKPRNALNFRKRLEYRVDLAVGDALDSSLQPPLPHERTHAAVIAMKLGVPVPEDVWHRRNVLLQFLKDHSAPQAKSPLAITLGERR